MEAHFHNATVVSIALIATAASFCGAAQRLPRAARRWRTGTPSTIDRPAIGRFQCLSLIPGTSRPAPPFWAPFSSARTRAGAEFSFFMAIPTMLGASAIKGLKFLLSGVSATGTEIGVLIVGCVVSFLVSLLVIRD
ncbi:MAG: undecaprenyl-diphosphate phosphatase [Flavonifractor plautii]